jgi:hypothetical protein
LPGYTLEVANRQNRSGGGVCNYIRNDIIYEQIENHMLSKLLSFEGIVTKLKLNIARSSHTIFLLTIYRPPNTCLEQYNNDIDNLLHELNKSVGMKNSLVVVGDFNIDLIKISQHKHTLNFFNILLAHNLVPTITKPTRITEFSSTLIDNIFITNHPFAKFSFTSGIIYSDLSDHFPCFINLNLNSAELTNNYNSNNPTATRKYNSQNYAKFAQLLKLINWDKYNNWTNKSDVNAYFDFFHKEFSTIFDQAFPLITSIKANAKSQNRPWLTSAIINSCKTKNNLYIIYKKYPSLLNLTNYKNYNKKLQQCLRLAEQKHYLIKLQNTKDDTKAKWLLINQILNRNNLNSYPISFTINNNTTTDKKLIVEAFNSYYINLGSSLATKIPSSSLSPYVSLNPIHYTSAVFLPSTEQEIIAIINNLKNDSSPGWDNIPNSVLKFAKYFISGPLTHIVNCMIITGTFPNQLKIAKVIPCYKSGDKSLITNYRPISILNSLSKIFEKVIVARLKSFIAKNNILYNFQFGFRENYSTNLALISYIDYITSAIDSGDKVASVFIDLSKAFDTLNHKILINKLNLYGIRGQVLSLFASYLSNRKQYVQYHNQDSSLQIINCGVPQGSILGPILFLLYINDIYKCSSLLKLILFADDTTLSFKHKNIDELTKILNVEINKISEWMRVNKLSINISKTFYILFRPSLKLSNNIKLAIDGCEIHKVSHLKFLGIFIDDKLSWKIHIKHLESKVSSLIGILSKIRFKINIETSNLIYDGLIISQLNYCNVLWASGYKTTINKLETLQARALRICNRLDYKLSKPKTFALLNRLSLSQLNKLNILKFVYQTIKGYSLNIFKDFYITNKDKSHHITRLQNNIFIPHIKTNFRKLFVVYTGCILWNKLPDSVKSITSSCSFKIEIKKLLLSSTLTF